MGKGTKKENQPSKKKEKPTKVTDSNNNNNNNQKNQKKNENTPIEEITIIIWNGKQKQQEKITNDYLTIASVLFDFARHSLQTKITFPTTLSPKSRSEIHEIAESYQLIHKSISVGENRELNVEHDSINYDSLPLKTPKELAEIQKYKEDSVKEKKDRIPKGASCILENFLYLGSGRDGKDIDQLQELGITNVCNVAKEWSTPSSKGITFYHAKFVDNESQNLSEKDMLKDTFQFLLKAKEQKKKVLVHCVMGKSRSAAIVIAYLMHYEKMTLKQAFEHVKERRDIIKPNEGFLQQLIQMEKDLYGTVTFQIEK